VRGRELPQPLEVARRREHEPHVARHRLDDHRRDLVAVGLEQRLRGGQVVERRDERVGRRARRDARAVGEA
jgi:hypothetical protein